MTPLDQIPDAVLLSGGTAGDTAGGKPYQVWAVPGRAVQFRGEQVAAILQVEVEGEPPAGALLTRSMLEKLLALGAK